MVPTSAIGRLSTAMICGTVIGVGVGWLATGLVGVLAGIASTAALFAVADCAALGRTAQPLRLVAGRAQCQRDARSSSPSPDREELHPLQGAQLFTINLRGGGCR
ncbi:hypothetical protein [Antrihabitans spumae]|uniref:Uncharacterized protein n=1 Tax=Antrihabitans spumae TaxID=3373370 RepID=A0ABW7KHH7_9NOCA